MFNAGDIVERKDDPTYDQGWGGLTGIFQEMVGPYRCQVLWEDEHIGMQLEKVGDLQKVPERDDK